MLLTLVACLVAPCLLPDDAGAEARLLLDYQPGPDHSSTTAFRNLGTVAVFEARTPTTSELWRTDGTPEGTYRIAASFVRVWPVTFGGNAVFTAKDFSDPLEEPYPDVWVTDGTLEGTRRLRIGAVENPNVNLPPGAWLASRRLFFLRAGPLERPGLYVTDGTMAGTRPVAEAALAGHRVLGKFVATREYVAFVARDMEIRQSIWVSDGTEAGTRKVFDFQPLALAAAGDRIFALSELGLWTWRQGAPTLLPLPGRVVSRLTTVGDRLFLVTDDAAGTQILWVSDGTPPGTAAVKTLAAPDAFLNPEFFLSPLDNRIVFAATTAEHGREAWSSDGTPSGTRPLEACPGPCSSLAGVTVVAAGLALSLDNGVSGVEEWWSDGTPESLRQLSDLCPGSCSSSRGLYADLGTRWVIRADDGVHGLEWFALDPRTGSTERLTDLPFTPQDPGGFAGIWGRVGTKAVTSFDDGVHGKEPWAIEASAPCLADESTLCLGEGRFAVRVDWKDFGEGRGVGRAVQLTSDTGYFWFFSPENIELIVKVLDGGPVNGHYWTFYGALSSVEYALVVADTQTGASRRYFNPSGFLASFADVESFGPYGAMSVVGSNASAISTVTPQAATTEACVASPTRLCLGGGRFAVEARWTDFEGNTGVGQGVVLTPDTGYFWFFGENNVEVVLKVLDGRALNGKFWVFYGALSSVEYTVTVTDTQTGVQRVYHNPSGRLASLADTAAF